ncbi:Uma2 family endonuclease [Crocosphaera sp.]|uniref:Uma2 family endonuclease n=1 Tax=Crocosphaera sp. TaxID=2729996 RepID=UPI003F282344|nr:Uma2 family endonuclease [Crocosphaera sp.]
MQIFQQNLTENRVILNDLTWETFNQILKEIGNKRVIRLAYDQGIVEIMTPFGQHEYSNRFIDNLILVIALELNLNIKTMGSLTLKKEMLKKGVEPDSCYYLNNEPLVRQKQDIRLDIDPPPDLVLEIDMSNSSLNKLPIYAALGVPEIWRYDGNQLIVFILSNNHQNYVQSDYSSTFSWLKVADLLPFIDQSLREGETTTLKHFRHWIQQQTR